MLNSVSKAEFKRRLGRCDKALREKSLLGDIEQPTPLPKNPREDRWRMKIVEALQKQIGLHPIWE